MYGMISQRASIWQEIFGGTSTQAFGAAYTRAVNDPAIQAIVFDVDSPGGTVAGVEELSDLIFDGSRRKDTYAIANSQAASAAYWLASQVGKGRFFGAPGADVGSIGVFRMHEDVSGMLAQDGVKVSFIAVPEYKTEANPYEPLSEEAREFHQSQVESTYQEFVADVRRGRGVSLSRVDSDFGRGRTFHSTEAAERGMLDGVKTLRDMITGFGTKAQVSLSAATDTESKLSEAWLSGLPVEMVTPYMLSPSESAYRRKLKLS
jgi:signal peptide peptidase SppA